MGGVFWARRRRTAQGSITDLSDLDLWHRIRDGDTEALGAIFDRHADHVYNACFRRTANWTIAEDLVTVVFLETWRMRGSIELSGISAEPLLSGVATSLCHRPPEVLQHFRPVLRKVLAPSGFETSANIDQKVNAEREMSMFLRSTESMAQAERDVLLLCTVEGFGLADAAESLRIPYGTVVELATKSNNGHGIRFRAPAEQMMSAERFDARRVHLIEQVGASSSGYRSPDTIPEPRSQRRWIGIAASVVFIVAVASGSVVALQPVINGGSAQTYRSALLMSASKTTQSHSARFSISYKFPQKQFSTDGVYDFGTSQASATVKNDAGVSNVVVDHDTEYSQPANSDSVDAGTFKSSELDGTRLENDVLTSAELSLYLRAASANTTKVRSETLRGETTTRYKTLLDFDRASKDAKLPSDKAFYHDQAQTFAASPLPAEAWIDAQGRVRKLVLPNAGAKGTEFMGGQTFSIEYYDYGVPVQVQLPDPSMVVRQSA